MIKVLVVDDSLFMRRLVSDMLDSDPEIKVIDTAKDGAEAVRKIPQMKPDVVTLDLVMSGWDGLKTLKHIMSQNPTPVIILSAYSKKDADITMDCLHAGAVAFVLKPSGELSLDIENIKHQLLEEVKAAAKVDVGRIRALVAKKPKERRRRKVIGINKIIVIGSSTGGPQTLEAILSSLPPDFSIPIIVVQHIPTEFFTQSLAEHLNRICELEVKVAEDGEALKSGNVYLAPAGFQTRIEIASSPATFGGEAPRNDVFVSSLRLRGEAEAGSNLKEGQIIISLTKEEPGELTPSIDITMKSVAEVYNGGAVGIILTGMGRDGLQGMKAIKEAQGKTVVQDESSLIFGMPKAVIDEGIADSILPADRIADAMAELVS